MTASNDPDAIRAQIDRTRAELSQNVDTLADTANPRNIASKQMDRVSDAARSVKEKVMGAPDDPRDDGRLGDAREAASQAGDALSQAPDRAKQKTRGNPLAAGLIAFGVGALISSLVPPSEKEKQAAQQLQEELEPLKEEASGVAQQMAEQMREPAQEAVESVRETATSAAQDVRDEGLSARDQIQEQAQDSAQNVRNEAQH